MASESVTIMLNGSFDEVRFKVLELAAKFGLAAAAWRAPSGVADCGYPLKEHAPEPERAPFSDYGTGGTVEPAAKTVEERVAAAVADMPAAKRHRRTKAEMEAARLVEMNAAAKEAHKEQEIVAEAAEPKLQGDALDRHIVEDLGGDPTPEFPVGDAPKPTVEDLRDSLRRLLSTDGQGQEACAALLKRYGVKKLSDLNEVEWPKFIAEADKLAGVA